MLLNLFDLQESSRESKNPLLKLIPNPIRENINIDIQNLSADANLSIIKTDVFSGEREEIL